MSITVAATSELDHGPPSTSGSPSGPSVPRWPRRRGWERAVITRPWAPSTWTRRSPARPSGPRRTRGSGSPAMLLTGYRQIAVMCMATSLVLWLNYTDRSVCSWLKKERLSPLRALHQLQGGVTGDLGGVGRPLDQRGHGGPLDEQGDGRGQRRGALADRLLEDAPQQLGEPPLVVPDEPR